MSLWLERTCLDAVVLGQLRQPAFLVVGVYRGLWRYASLGDAVLFTKAVALGSAGSLLLVVFVFRFEGFSRTVFLLDGILDKIGPYCDAPRAVA